jgi:putative addiction module component (TIGR02574 family)
MTTAAIRKKLVNYMQVADDKKVKAMYALFEDDIEQEGLEYTDELKTELDKRYADYKSGKAKMITAEESKKRIQKVLKAARK